jgi:hypothetical protein
LVSLLPVKGNHPLEADIMKALLNTRRIGTYGNKNKLTFYLDNIENVERKKACKHNSGDLVFIGTEDTDYGYIHHYHCKGCRQAVIEPVLFERDGD